MIEIYNPGNDRYDLNGDAVLFPTVCDMDVSLDSVWSIEIEHPIDDEGRWKYIVNNAVIQVTSFKFSQNVRQLYRIRKVDISDNGVKALAKPIWMDAQDEVFLVDVRPINKTGQEALDIILKSNSKYKAESDIFRKSTAYYILKNAAEAIMGSDNSFLERWGGEVLYDNYKIIINEKIGEDNGFEIVYGKNILTDGLKETIEMDSVVTRIVPKSFNGYTLVGDKPWVDSPLINRYPTIRTKVIEFPNIKLQSDLTGDEPSDTIICPTLTVLRTRLTEAARNEFNKGIDKPKVTISCKLASIERTEEYKDYKHLFKLGLGDTVHCRHNKLEIVTDARVRAIKWDCIKETVKEITIGDEYKSFIERVSSSIGSTEKALTKAGSVKASNVAGTINMDNAQLKYQKNIAQKQNVRAILFEDLDPNSASYGAMCLGSLGFEIANARNEEDTDWVWTTFGTAQGFTANLINAGTLNAINIEGSYIKGGNIEGTNIKGSKIEGNEIIGGKITGSEIEGALFNGGTTAGGIIAGSVIDGSIIRSDGRHEHAGEEGVGSLMQMSYGALWSYGYEITPKWLNTVNIENGAIYAETFDDWSMSSPSIRLSSITSDGFFTRGETSDYKLYNDDVEGSIIYHDVSQSLGTIVCAGHVTQSGTILEFFIPLRKLIRSNRNVSISYTNLSVRGPDGYVGGSIYALQDLSLTQSVIKADNGLRVRLTNSVAFTNISNNRPVSVMGTFTIFPY